MIALFGLDCASTERFGANPYDLSLIDIIFRPGIFANFSNSSSVWLTDSFDPFKNIDVSSAYCEILNSVPFNMNPLDNLIMPHFTAIISAHRMKMSFL